MPENFHTQLTHDGEIVCNTYYGGTKTMLRSQLIFRPSSYAIVLHEDHVLVVRNRRTEQLYFPGGGVELGEPIERAAEREVGEETGLQVRSVGLAHFEENFFYYDPDDMAGHCLLFYFECVALTHSLSQQDELIDGEAARALWLPLSELDVSRFITSARGAAQWLMHKKSATA
jgi:8-oxo-dGTP pyrophosphatase MutT (NUDIX family)